MPYASKRSWGLEIVLLIIPGFISVKFLWIKSGHRGGLQYHHIKKEAGLILKGKLLVEQVQQDNIIKSQIKHPGDSYVFEPRAVHRETALNETLILEISTPHFNDRYRIDDDSDNILGTTSIDEVILIDSDQKLRCLESIGFKRFDINRFWLKTTTTLIYLLTLVIRTCSKRIFH